jgi:NAD(P)H dehydrogenase (quinone)
MLVVMGITGKVGGSVAETLLHEGLPVRGVVRSADRGSVWQARGCEVAVVSDTRDASALADAFKGATGVFVMNPPNYDTSPDFADSRHRAETVAEAVRRSEPGRVVLLSTVGAQAQEFNLLNWAQFFERALANTGVPFASLRAAWFMENAAWDVASARTGRIESYLQPLDRAIEMVSARDVGRIAADLIREMWAGQRIIELAGPRPYSPNDVAVGLAGALGHPVEALAVPKETWERRFRAEGMQHPEARIRMLDGFNEGWIDFEKGPTEQRVGTTELAVVLRDLTAKG